MKCFTTALAEKFGLAKDRFPKTAQEAALAEEALAHEMNKLSLDEHERILFDMHGLAKMNDEDPENLDAPLEELEIELRKIPEKPAYDQALYMNEGYVRSRNLRLMFLRAERFDAKATAQNIVDHFKRKRELFGQGDVLAREVRLSDLHEDDVTCLKSGFVQVLPSRDGAGRAIVFCAHGYRQYTTMDSLARAQWYFFQKILRDEETQRRGVVFVVYNVGKYGKHEGWEFMSKVHCGRFPLKMVANHVCYSDEAAKPFIAGMRLFMREEVRNRVKVHFKSTAEDIEFHLQTYAIPTNDLPINEEETLELGWHLEWIEAERVQESKATKDGADESIIVPRRFDVLFGRGRSTRQHTGNLRASHLVEMHQAKYEKANKFQKTEIAERIVAIVHESYGRFLKWEDGGWVEVGYDSAREKVSHFFRHLRSKKGTVKVTTKASEVTASEGSSSESDSSDDKMGKAVVQPKKKKVFSITSFLPKKKMASSNLVGINSRLPNTPAALVC